ncbi:MAG: dephospho-CoA kinase [Crocinitomicaceae bacterium]|jgi:dephospho-CoA kinase
MLKIGITGGIGSGKSLIGKILESLEYPVFYSDVQAKDITNNNEEVRTELIKHFGDEVFMDGTLNRQFLAEKIFSNSDERIFVNNLIHPKVREAYQYFAQSSKSPFVFNEAAILFETGSYKQFDKTILVTAPDSVRIERVMDRDHCSAEDVKQRMSNQWDDVKKIPLADFVIVNDGTKPLIDQVEKILKQLGSSL